jgi:hypothetical protein
MKSYGFIMTRHVNSEKTNKYWNHSVKLLRTYYPYRKIVIIDDNSNQTFVKAEFDYTNIEIVQSEFPGRGEFLPYYYFIKNNYFDNAIIIHDSVFFHKRINFDILKNVSVIPLWFFHSDKENVENTIRISNVLKNNYALVQNLKHDTLNMMPKQNWYGCFGIQTYINRGFLLNIESKYNITNMLSQVTCRSDRCCLERIMGCIFFTENKSISEKKSLFGDIMKYQTWGYTFDEYTENLKKGTVKRPVVKIWTGR